MFHQTIDPSCQPKGKPYNYTRLLVTGNPVLRPHRTTITRNEHFDEMKSQPVTAPFTAIFQESIKNQGLHFIGNTWPRITYPAIVI